MKARCRFCGRVDPEAHLAKVRMAERVAWQAERKLAKLRRQLAEKDTEIARPKAIVEQGIEAMREAAVMVGRDNIKIVAGGLEQVADEMREAAEQAEPEKGEG